jgi:hypothetical protein
MLIKKKSYGKRKHTRIEQKPYLNFLATTDPLFIGLLKLIFKILCITFRVFFFSAASSSSSAVFFSFTS